VDRVDSSPPEPIASRICFKDVHFQYQPHLPEALRGVTFEIQPGETVALVGHSGAGKSTCANLLLRLWDVTKGQITIAGHDLRDFTQESLRERIAYVPQDVYLFNRSVRENIRLGLMEANEQRVKNAAALAQALDFIMELPQGWDTPIGERGVLLSGGQRQRLAIARAMLRDTPILVMDEAVSNLDTESEFAIKEAISRVGRGRTTMIIAHRLSTIMGADRIVALENGRVVETGIHEELIRSNGAYARLISSPSSGIIR
jgi:ABC-type multidrug transport system fused ATPase/permease subunit